MNRPDSRPWIPLADGAVFEPENPEGFRIATIAHALANQCRFTGHTSAFYSVAQHCCFVSDHLDYRALQERIDRAIAAHFGLSWPEPAAVRFADLYALAVEKRDLMKLESRPWAPLPSVPDKEPRLMPWSPERARAEYVSRAVHLGLCEWEETR